MSKILLDDTDLKLYLEKKRKFIGKRNDNAISDLFAGITVAIPNFFAKYNDFLISGTWWKNILIGLGSAYSLKGIISFIKNAIHKYTYEQLYKDIQDMNAIEHQFSIVAVKDTFNDYPNRYLLHYEPDWKCDLFFSFRTMDSETENIENIKAKLSSLLKVDKEKIQVEYKKESIYSKYSVKDKEQKIYHHRLYLAEIKKFPKDERQDQFSLDGIDYKWLSIADMRKDIEIQAKNLDVVDMVYECT